VDALPLDEMWDDARYWLPKVLAGERVRVAAVFAPDCATVATIEVGQRYEEPDGQYGA
jgi:8-oxo-dGTP diphosphatase